MNDPHQTVGPSQDGPISAAVLSTSDHPIQQIGRYRVKKVLGEGGFGRVYLAHDDELRRLVAIKVPRSERLSGSEDAEAYLTEARMIASLDHGNIVPIFDVGTTPDGLCFVVSKVIEGSDLAQKIRQMRLSYAETSGLIATVAEALHYAHGKGLVHRDIKPANILIDAADKPYLTDFGLALKDEDFGKGAAFAGTPAYMSPEQARGEGHRVDGRSDIFSLGVVFYELLVGRRPFKGDSQQELLEQITAVEARPPRQVDDRIPKELERICFKALSKRASERYMTAKDMADDLRHFLSQQPNATTTSIGPPTIEPTVQPPSTVGGLDSAARSTSPHSESRPLRMVPKGLRSFDAGDADFFLELLPGPRDRDGLPDSLRFWKTRVEETDADDTFAVGLIYGPSGCGKSSLVKAGLLPRLSKNVFAIYVEATSEDTETRLLGGLRKRCQSLSDKLSLKDTLAALRRGQGIPAGKKVVIVLDQFEQWLHAKKEEQNTELVQALRQCDGGRLQCVVMVRDDFWLAVSRFLRDLEIRLVEGQNSALVDLFDADHARRVLAAFGRAFGRLPENHSQTTKEQKEFLNQAIAGLAQEGKVVCIRLALFAEMMKGKSWTPASLKAVGGTAGVGVTFLEETFSASTAPPEHRYHQKAARANLSALLPETGTDIKGHMRSYAELLKASGYEDRVKDFEDLIRILDNQIRLITPTDPEGKVGADETSPAQPGQKYYQLTHDYLVPALWEWLTRKQKETRRGRAELALADRAAVWNARPETRQLPSLLQWCQIRWLTPKKSWTRPQARMMRKAARYHGARALAVAAVVALLAWGGSVVHGTLKAHALLDSLFRAETAQVPNIVAAMTPYRRWLNPPLRDAYTEGEATDDLHKRLHASLALLPVDPSHVDYLSSRLLDASPNEVPVIRDALAPHRNALLNKLWAVAEAPEKGKERQRLRAAAALAQYDPDSEKWAQVQQPVANDMVVSAVNLPVWLAAFRPVRAKLLAPLAVIFRDVSHSDRERSLATDILADYAADRPQVLADLLMDAEEKQFVVIYPRFKEHGERGLPVLVGELDGKIAPGAKDNATEKLAKRQANAAVALLKMGLPEKAWPLLKHRPDPTARSYLIHRLAPLGVDAKVIVERLNQEPNMTIRRALILSLADFGSKAFSSDERKVVTAKLQDVYRGDADPGLHAAAEYLLRLWDQSDWLMTVNNSWAKDYKQREQEIKNALPNKNVKTLSQWYVNGQGQTMVVIPGPVEFTMGSPPKEAGRENNEGQHPRRIGRTFAVAAKVVTVEQHKRFDPSYKTLNAKYTRTADLPVVAIDWFEAAAYCNWLSKEEGISEKEWCYEADAKGQVTKLKEKYLSLTGYRLPTEAEMEYVTRAGASTSRPFGETDELLTKYAWCQKNSREMTWPVGSLKPNDFGLFDVQGNVYTWCQESYEPYPTAKGDVAAEDREDVELIPTTTLRRVLRGGSYSSPLSHVRSANRINYVPRGVFVNPGFRVARTLAP